MAKYDPKAAHAARRNKTQKAAERRRRNSAHPHVGGHDSNYRDQPNGKTSR